MAVMARRHFAIVLFMLAYTSAAVQQPFYFLDENQFKFKWPIRKVAVIGAGPSGLVAYRELTEAGLDVRMFERDSLPGGNWHYTEEIPLDAPVPNAPCAVSDFTPSLPPTNVDLPYSEEFADDSDSRIWRDHRAPKPIWEALTSNVPALVQQFPQWPWPPGTQWELSQYRICNYVRSYASYLGLNSNDGNSATVYNTRVELIEKRTDEHGEERGWRLWLRSLEPTPHNTYRATWWTEDFDAVVVATGTYNAPAMPSIPGLQEWVRRFPDSVRHSRQYRRPESYTNHTVLIIGASVSGAEISRDVNRYARNVYQSIRVPQDSASRARLEQNIPRLPRNTTIIGEIKQFLPVSDRSPIQSGLVELKNGTILSGFDSMILATGYRYSFPFLSQYYDGAVYQPHVGSASTVSTFLPISGLYIRDLYLDIFYLRDPTLSFMCMTRGRVKSFLLVDYMALAVAKVWTSAAKLPNTGAMQVAHEKTVEERGGYGKLTLHNDVNQFRETIQNLTAWLNTAAVNYGGKQIDGYPKEWDEVIYYYEGTHFGRSAQESEPEDTIMAALSRGLDGEEESSLDDGDDWFYYEHSEDW